MANECIVFSDPRSTTLIQIATLTGEQSLQSEWTGALRYSNLRVNSAQDRNSTASFKIISYNTVDSVGTWLVPGIGIFVVRSNLLYFSGVVSKVEGNYVGTSGKQVYGISCESDANYLMNYNSEVKAGTIHKAQTPYTIITDIVNPYTLWMAQGGPGVDNSTKVDYTISRKPMLVQIQDLAQITGNKYRIRTLVIVSTITRSSTTITFAETNPEGLYANPNGMSWGSHNKYILVGVGSLHNCAASVTAVNPGASQVTITVTNAINPALIATGQLCLLIQHPAIDFQPTLSRAMYTDNSFSATKKYYVNPTSDTFKTLAWEYNPTEEKNDVITKVTGIAQDVSNKPISVSMSSAFKWDVSDRKFFLQEASNKPFVDISYESNVLWSDLVLTGGVYKGKVQVFSDLGISWSAGNYCYLCQATGSGYQERAVIDSVANTGEMINGRPTRYLIFSSTGLTYYYGEGDLLGWAESGYSYSKIHLSSSSGITANAYYWVGSELVKVMSVSSPNIYCMRGMSFVSVKGYTVVTRVAAHKVGCPVTNGMPAAAESTKCFDIDDYYNGGGTYDSPMKAYGLNSRQLSLNKAVDVGTLELVVYNVLRNKCVPKNKGSFNCFINSLTGWLRSSNYAERLLPGDEFQIDFYGTVNPSGSTYFQIMGMDMDFDSNTAVVQFDEFDLTLLQYLQQNGLSINIT